MSLPSCRRLPMRLKRHCDHKIVEASLLAFVLIALATLLDGGASAAGLHLERVAGDRQIIVGAGVAPAPYTVRVMRDGSPQAGVLTWAAYPGRTNPSIDIVDEFGFRGFNVFGPHDHACTPFQCPGSYFVSDNSGYVTLVMHDGEYVPSAATVEIQALKDNGDRDPTVAPLVYNEVRVLNVPAGKPSVIVEYFNSEVRHYFMTLQDDEVGALDAGLFHGWSRSIGAFVAYATAADAPAGAQPVCRFFSSRYTSHFYSANVAECDAVAAQWPDVWTLETRAAFYTLVPDPQTGSCVAGYQPVFRIFNNGAAPNHRYVTDARLRDAMVARGWIAEGYGPDAVVYCAPM